jgi:hypothetical protein
MPLKVVSESAQGFQIRAVDFDRETSGLTGLARHVVHGKMFGYRVVQPQQSVDAGRAGGFVFSDLAVRGTVEFV